MRAFFVCVFGCVGALRSQDAGTQCAQLQSSRMLRACLLCFVGVLGRLVLGMRGLSVPSSRVRMWSARLRILGGRAVAFVLRMRGLSVPSSGDRRWSVCSFSVSLCFFFAFGRAGAPRFQDAGTSCAQLLSAKVVRAFMIFLVWWGAEFLGCGDLVCPAPECEGGPRVPGSDT